MTMDAERMHALACLYARDKTQEKLEEALDAALPLCALIARRFSRRGAEYDDLYQTACLACVQALRGFDPDRGYRFSTYVTPTVTGNSGVPSSTKRRCSTARGPGSSSSRSTSRASSAQRRNQNTTAASPLRSFFRRRHPFPPGI